MEKININLFDNLFSFINEIEQVGNNKEKIREIKNKKIQEVKKPLNKLIQNITSFFNNISEEIENLINNNYYYENLNDKMNFKEKETLFDKNYETLKRNENIMKHENDLKKLMNDGIEILTKINEQCINQNEKLGNLNNDEIFSIN